MCVNTFNWFLTFVDDRLKVRYCNLEKSAGNLVLVALFLYNNFGT